MSAKVLEGPKLTTLVPKKSLGQLFFDCATLHAENICQIDGTVDATETYSSVKTRSVRVSIELEKRGITSKDVVAFCASNTLDTVIPILATFYLGAKVANLEPSLSVQQTQHLICLVSPKIIFVTENAVELIENSLKKAKIESEIIVYGKSHKYTTLDHLLQPKRNEDSFRPIEVDLNEVTLIFFSSGTTGLPKAICHSHKSFINIGSTLVNHNLRKTLLHFTTFYWITASFQLIKSFMTGGSRVFLQSVDAEATFRTIEKYKVDEMFIAPILTNTLTNFKNYNKYNTTSLKAITCGGTLMSVSQFEKMVKTFEHSKVLITYGMTEVGVISIFHDDRDEKIYFAKPQCCGFLFPGMKLKITDIESGQNLGSNMKGEIRVKSSCMFQGYYNSDSSENFDQDGYLKTGDIGYYDEDGCIYVVDRIKEMFKYKSWHIVPALIETIIKEHPDVEDAVVFGIPCGEEGEIPAACVIPKSGTRLVEKNIEDFVASKVSDREKLRGGVFIRDDFPKTPTGKFIRKEIRNSVIKSVYQQ